MQLRASVIWITGASSGIGAALAMHAASAGAKLVLSGRRLGALEQVRSTCSDPARVALLPFDLEAFDADELHQAAVRFFGPIDILVNCAGIGQRGTLAATTLPVWRRVFEIDLFALVALTRAVVPAMQSRGRGQVVSVSSVAGRIGTPLRPAYSAVKHAVLGFMDSARAELARDGLVFTSVCPGYVRTPFSYHALLGDGSTNDRMDPGQAAGMLAADCALRIWHAVEHDRAEVWLGREALALWAQRFLPGLVRWSLARLSLDRFQNSTSNSST